MNILAGTQKKKEQHCLEKQEVGQSTQNRTEIWYFHLKNTPTVGMDIPKKGTNY